MGFLLLWKGRVPQAGLPSDIQAALGSISGPQGTTLEKTAPRGVGVRGQTLKTIRTECAHRSPQNLLS